MRTLLRWRRLQTAPASHLQAVSVHKDLGDGATPHIHILYPLGGNVLPLSQFEDVLLPVDDLQHTTLEETEGQRQSRWEPGGKEQNAASSHPKSLLPIT